MIADNQDTMISDIQEWVNQSRWFLTIKKQVKQDDFWLQVKDDNIISQPSLQRQCFPPIIWR